jgi:hypothetical protein
MNQPNFQNMHDMFVTKASASSSTSAFDTSLYTICVKHLTTQTEYQSSTINSN